MEAIKKAQFFYEEIKLVAGPEVGTGGYLKIL
jgi:hypothetical protein